ncbi:DUF4148 domain-containing protein [Burkholderia stagnalis]|uniref:DUF4148 domain-containing protein n=1 Tax=Burkholderia stagnalis TaxID=1503054 RepID=UPI000757C340|nr:DUF4148 domain-containing protein [Burkholderia stagnalis]KVC58594.1 hypothetical protein WS59_22215 [Burkholderia stagnalis]KVD94494.1 hypothetical protein WS63_05070 [Burkholderia stagnalis]KVM83931.1 hypothetical protein WT05_18095 [Burkholderia stagnalis]KVN15415.1 hypothetical protein WT10_22685 [Burkholderia stagnalis]KVO59411.1 hypothetical protein WT18_12585 [Burkholderia stagnalis]
MKNPLIATLLVAVSASFTASAFASDEAQAVTRAQVRAELRQLQRAGYQPGRANDPHYPEDLQAALKRIHASDAVAGDTSAAGYGAEGEAAAQSGGKRVILTADRSIYFGH